MKDFFLNVWNFVRTVAIRVWIYAKAHKILASVAVLLLLALGYWAISTLAKGAAITSYTLSPATQGNLDVTITDSGEVSAEHQLSLSPKASGSVTSVNVVAGQSVSAGTIIATVDSSDANDSLHTAQENLTSAQISYKQSLTSSQNSLTNDQNSLRTETTGTSNAITTAFTSLPGIMSGTDSVLHNLSTIPAFSQQNLDAYANYINTTEAHQQRDQIVLDYQQAVTAYQSAQSAYGAFDVTTATPEQTITLAQTSIPSLQATNKLLRDTLTFLNYVNSEVQSGSRNVPPNLSSHISTITGYLNTVTSDITSIQSAKTSLVNAQQTLEGDTQSLDGSTVSLSVQSAQLNLQKAQESLAQAEKAEENYIVRAPFDGTIASVSVKKYDQASSGSAVAVLITKENYVTLAVNEADASAIAVGQKAAITFDAIDTLTIEGTVAEVDQVGTVSQGVATYSVKIGFDSQDARIKPGMTAEATITTASAENAIQVPSAAVHTTGNMSYIEVATLTGSSTTMTGAPNRQFAAGTLGSSTGRFRLASSTFATSTAIRTTVSRSLSIPASQVKITRVPVTLGISNDTMIQITSGLNRGQLVVTGTTNGNGKSSAATSGSIFSLFGGARRTTTTGATGAAGNRTFSTQGRSSGAGAAGFSGGAAVRVGGF